MITAQHLKLASRLLLFIFVPFSAIMLLLSVWLTLSFLRVAQPSQGTVLELVEKRDDKSGLHYYPRVQHQTSDGRSAEFVSRVGSFPPDYSVGETVRVLYNPEKLSRGEINSTINLWGFTFASTFALGFCAVLIAVFELIRRRLESKTRNTEPAHVR